MKSNSRIGLGLMTLAFMMGSAGSSQTLAGTRSMERAQASSNLPSFVSEVDNEFFPLRPGTTCEAKEDRKPACPRAIASGRFRSLGRQGAFQCGGERQFGVAALEQSRCECAQVWPRLQLL